RADRAEAGLLPNPIISAALGAASDGGFAQPLSLRLMFPLMWLWQRPDRVAAAEAGLRATILSAADRATRIVIGARGDHMRARMAELAAEQAEALVMTRQDQLQLATILLEAGLTTRAAHARAALAAGDARNGLAKRRAEAEAARRNLLKRIGRAEGDATFVLGAAIAAQTDQVLPGETELAHLTLEQRLDVAAARAAVKSAEARVELADFARWPGLSAAIGYDKNFQGAEAMIVGAQITPPLFDQGSVTIARAEASERLQTARALAVSQEAVRETRVAYRWYLAAQERHQRFRGTMLPAAEEDRAQADAELEAGTLDAAAALAARARAIVRRIEAYDLDLARALARLELERAIGGPLSREEARP
ncbi:MAG: TolC family protein, partial [Planctomycetota bacterium]